MTIHVSGMFADESRYLMSSGTFRVHLHYTCISRDRGLEGNTAVKREVTEDVHKSEAEFKAIHNDLNFVNQLRT